MPLIDDAGNLFGRWNVIDATIVVGFVGLLTIGAWFAIGAGVLTPPSTKTVEVTALTSGPSYVVDAINESERPADDDLLGVSDVQVVETYIPNSTNVGYNRTEYRVRFGIRVVAERQDGQLHFHGGRLYVDRQLTLDLNTTIVEGRVVAIQEGDDDG